MRAATQTESDALPESRAADTDAALIERSWQEPRRFADVFDRHYAAIHGYMWRRLGSSSADDLASETFLIAFDRRRRYDTAHPDALPWLYGIASNLVRRHRRSEVRRYRALAKMDQTHAVEGHAERVVVSLDARALRGRLAAALAGITGGDRDVLLLVAWAGLSCEEAARALGIPPGTARSRLHRARKQTRAVLGDAGEEHEE